MTLKLPAKKRARVSTRFAIRLISIRLTQARSSRPLPLNGIGLVDLTFDEAAGAGQHRQAATRQPAGLIFHRPVDQRHGRCWHGARTAGTSAGGIDILLPARLRTGNRNQLIRKQFTRTGTRATWLGGRRNGSGMTKRVVRRTPIRSPAEQLRTNTTPSRRGGAVVYRAVRLR